MESGRQLSKFTAIFAGGTFVSRISGFIREMVWFALIPTQSIGPFLVAFKFPNMLRDLVGEGATNAAFIPVFSESIEKESKEAFRDLVSATMSAMLIVLGVLTVLGLLLLPFLSQSMGFFGTVSAKAVAGQRIELIISLSLWTFPYLFFIGMTVFAMGPLFTVRHYATPSWSPALLNVAVILCCWKLAPLFVGRGIDPAYALVVGVWLGGIAQLVVQYMALAKYAGVWLPNFHLTHPAIPTMFLLLLPVLIGQSTGEVNKFVDTLFAAVLGDDKVKALTAANRLIQLPFSIFGLAVAAAVLPAASRAGARQDFEEIRYTLIHGLRQTFFLVFPSSVGLICLRGPIVRLLFERGNFTAVDTGQTATAVLLYGLGLLSFVWVKVLVSGFYAVKDTKTPVIVASASMVLNILLNFAMVKPLGYKGLAIATTISYTVNFAVLYALLCARFGSLWDREFAVALLRMIVAGSIMLAVAYGVNRRILLYFPTSRLYSVVIPIFCASAVYAVLCYFLDVPDLRSFLDVLRGKREES